MATRSRKAAAKKTRFVPRVVFATVVVGAAVPICVSACSSSSPLPATVADSGFARDTGLGATVADAGFSRDTGLGATVAAMGFDSGLLDTGLGATVAAMGFDSAAFSVADVGFIDTGTPIDGSAEAGDAHEEG